ncbi:MAG: tRNA pseudouridine(38-40) synthase TruA [Armatimonadetes bacterium]|nr:tRNA pseudouridine(38-40) synthase TruA [Armatimonadota bacterium]
MNSLTEARERRIRLVIQYDGTDFCGWAEQKDVRTVQGTLKESICRVCGESADLRGASRTDAGAHALGQVADFLTPNPMPPAKWELVLNRVLPPDTRIARASRVPLRFHSRFFARSRVYEYRISERARVEPTRSRYVYECGTRLDTDPMEEAAASLPGEHDFRAFSEKLDALENATRRVLRASVRRARDEVRILLEASAFVRGMARRIAGGLFEVGRGKRSVSEFRRLLVRHERDGVRWPVVLPAKGLTLLKVRYGVSHRDVRES